MIFKQSLIDKIKGGKFDFYPIWEINLNPFNSYGIPPNANICNAREGGKDENGASALSRKPNGHGTNTTPKDVRTLSPCPFPLSISPPQAGESDKESLRDVHVNVAP